MTLAAYSEPTVSYEVGSRSHTLDAVRRAGINVAIWRRTHPAWTHAALTRWLEHAPAERLNVALDFRDGVRAGAGCAELLDSFKEPLLRDYLLADLFQLAIILRDLSGQTTLHAQLGAAHTDRCRKLHVDYVRLRLITTYLGPGTEWLPDAAARRSVLDEPPECHLEANKRIAPDARRLRRARAGEVLVLKGELEAPGGGAIHRSPPIEATGEARIVLSLTAR